jgi:hypothetical protein
LNAQNAWEVFSHPPYSLNLASGDIYLFTRLKQFWDSTFMGSNEEVKKVVKDWFNELAADFYNVGTQKHSTQYDKCLNLNGDYVEK